MNVLQNMKLKTLALISAFLIAGCGSNEKSPDLNPEYKKAMLYYQQGTQELIAKNYTKALGFLLKANDIDPENDEIKNNLGMAYFLKGQEQKAKDEFEKAISINSKNSDARNNLASIYFTQKDFKKANREYEKILEDLTYNKMFRVYYNLGLIQLELNNPDKAKNYFSKSIDENSNYCAAFYQLGQIQVAERDFQAASKTFLNGTKGTCISDPSNHFEYAINLVRLNKPIEAKLKFKEIAEKFAKTKYAALSLNEINEINNERSVLPSSKQIISTDDETKTIQTPNF